MKFISSPVPSSHFLVTFLSYISLETFRLCVIKCYICYRYFVRACFILIMTFFGYFSLVASHTGELKTQVQKLTDIQI